MSLEVVYMKLLKKDNKEKMYLQISDIIFIFQHEYGLPDDIRQDFNDKLSKKNRKGLDDTPYTFKMFTEPTTVDFIKGLDYVVDYDSHKKKSVQDIFEEACVLQDRKQELAITFNKLNLKEREKNQQIVRMCAELDFTILSLRDLAWFKEGAIKMIIPESKKAKKTERKMLKQKRPKI